MPRSILIRGADLVEGGREDILIEGGRIRKIGPGLPWRGAELFPARGLLASPGLIDTQFNGGLGISFSEADPGRIAEVGRWLLGVGVTGYLPTLTSQPRETILRAIRNLVAASRISGGARILGIHLEGPFLSVGRRGAHRAENLRRPSLAEFRAYHREARGLLRMMTLAPELPGAMAVIREGTRRGVIMSAGHTQATAAQVREAMAKGGLRHVTHVFNAMEPLHHREEVALNAALTEDGLSCGMIYDRHHISAGTARLLLRAKKPGGLVLVSDAAPVMGAPDGEIRADGERYLIRDGRVTVKETGRLAGSARSILDGVRFLVADLGLAPAQALSLATAAPAALLGLGRKGALRPGADADIVLLGKGLKVRATFVGGRLEYADHHRA